MFGWLTRKFKQSNPKPKKKISRKTSKRIHVGPEGGTFKIRVINGHRKKVYV